MAATFCSSSLSSSKRQQQMVGMETEMENVLKEPERTRSRIEREITLERACCETFGCSMIERVCQGSPIHLLTTDRFFLKDFWMKYVHFDALRPLSAYILACGSNKKHQLGIGETVRKWVPEVIPSLIGSNVLSVSCGDLYAMALLESDEVVSWGRNDRGQLGVGDTNDRSIPTKIDTLSGKHVVEIACKGVHSMALLGNGNLYTWGNNNFGQLGLGDEISKSSPQKVNTLSERCVVKIACGFYHSLALLDNGDVFAWGFNFFGQLGLGDQQNRRTPQLIESISGRNSKSISGGACHSLILLTSGELLFAGDKNLDIFGQGEAQSNFEIIPELENKKIVSISCGFYHCMAVQSTGDLFSWGKNEQGQLGLGDTDDHFTPRHVAALDGKHVSKISCGGSHSMALLKNREVFAWGDTTAGKLGIEGVYKIVTIPKHVPTLDGKGVISIECGGNFSVFTTTLH